jgi:hypothetical protein
MGKLEKAHFGHLPVWCEGNVYIKGAVPSRHETDGPRRIITSDILGKAFEPDQRFENPDGSEIVFDTDYYGKKRSGAVIPGPFAELNSDIL